MTASPVILAGGPNGYDSPLLNEEFRYAEPPRQLTFGVTNFCNLSCEFCDVGAGNKGKPFFDRLVDNRGLDGHHDCRTLMPRDELRKLVDQLPAFMPDGTFSIIHAEPLIHPEIGRVVEDFTSHRLNLSITTNGTSLKKYAERLVRAGLNNINVSFEGTPEVNDRIRGSGAFARAYDGIREVAGWKRRLGLDRPTIRLQTVLMAKNVGMLPQFVDMWRRDPLGADLTMLTFQHLFFTTNEAVERTKAATGLEVFAICDTDPALREIDEATYGRMRAEIAAMEQDGLPFAIRFKPDLPSPRHAEFYFRQPEKPIVTDRCEFPLSTLYVNVDGKVSISPRCAFKGIELGNIYDQTLAEIWNGPIIREWRRNLATQEVPEVCNRCCVIFVSKMRGNLNFVS